MAETIWSVFPPILTIVLALMTKEVYMSLLIGIFSGAMLYSNFNVIQAILTMFAVMEEKVGGNVNILVFLVILGILVAAISRSGATEAYGRWAGERIHGKRSALFLTAFLGMIIFIDDYFNCLTVGRRRPSAFSHLSRAGRRPSVRRFPRGLPLTASRCSCGRFP